MRYFAMVAAGATLWGCWPLFLRQAGLTGAQNALLALLIMSLPAPFLLRREALRDRRALIALVAMGVADAINVALFFAAVRRGPVAVAVLTHYLAPLLVALAAPWVMRERRSMRALLGTPLTLIGLGLLIWKPGEDFSGWTAALGGASAIFFAITVFGAKEAARVWSPLGVTSVHAAIAVATLLLFFGRSALPPLELPVLWVVAGGVLSGLIGNILFNSGLRRIPTAAASALTYLEPLTASLVGWVFFSEALGSWGLLGGALVLGVGVWVAAESRVPEDSPLAPISSTS
ncbi:DMT family transporter [Hyalangium rubrum]|uniref:EamA family transporter n=1 Tax=Hyalangium rubrum TaxID=3103134 RepID=A0ABU5H883_9BACT|nr:EamA family transporter [Hyalangium sp. s54d21]MDY7229688.1 EamA family transporter [Hyalangium sp. s54d21]